MKDTVRSLVTGLPLDLRFQAKGQLVADVLGGAYADGVTFDLICATRSAGTAGVAGVPRGARAGVRAARRVLLHAHARRRNQGDLRGRREEAAGG